MAQGAAKKAAAAQAATANIYQPLLLATNVIYLLLLIGIQQEWTLWLFIRIVLNWGLQVFAYMAILDQARNNNKKKTKELIGGVHLDLLALTILIQFGSILHSTKWFYLLVLVPLGGGWTFYSTFIKGQFPMSNSNPSDEGSTTPSASLSSDDKRQKRAQKRSQKWS